MKLYIAFIKGAMGQNASTSESKLTEMQWFQMKARDINWLALYIKFTDLKLIGLYEDIELERAAYIRCVASTFLYIKTNKTLRYQEFKNQYNNYINDVPGMTGFEWFVCMSKSLEWFAQWAIDCESTDDTNATPAEWKCRIAHAYYNSVCNSQILLDELNMLYRDAHKNNCKK